MANTIKISGISDELLSRVDERWKGQHFADRSEYVRDLIRRDVLTELPAGSPTLAQGIKTLFGALHEEAARRGDTDESVAAEIDDAVAEVRNVRKRRSQTSAS